MNPDEFLKTINEKSMDYARGCVYDYNNHMDEVLAIASDYFLGACVAYNLLIGFDINPQTID